MSSMARDISKRIGRRNGKNYGRHKNLTRGQRRLERKNRIRESKVLAKNNRKIRKSALAKTQIHKKV